MIDLTKNFSITPKTFVTGQNAARMVPNVVAVQHSRSKVASVQALGKLEQSLKAYHNKNI